MRKLRIVPDGTRLRFMWLRNVTFPVSAVLLVASVLGFIFVGPDYGIDFRGGTMIEMRPQAELGEESLYRCLHAARLYHRGEPCPVLVSGGKVDPDRPGPTLADLMRDFLLRLGVAEEDLIVEGRSRTTYENAVESAALLREHGIEKIQLVADAVDLLRAALCFRKQGLDVLASGCNYRATGWRWRLFGFLPSPGAAKAVERVTHEWLGVAWYWLRGRI